MIGIGVICILIGILAFWRGNGWYREARTDLPSFKSTECVEQGNFCLTLGIFVLLIGVFFIIGNFIII